MSLITMTRLVLSAESTELNEGQVSPCGGLDWHVPSVPNWHQMALGWGTPAKKHGIDSVELTKALVAAASPGSIVAGTGGKNRNITFLTLGGKSS